jgi:hypothetical protein
VPASMVPSSQYSCSAKSDGKSTVVRCTTRSGGGGDHHEHED